jgi:tetratricopeptide (TPR) repeat protein
MTTESTTFIECTAAFQRALCSVSGDTRERERLLADGVRVIQAALDRGDASPRVWVYLGELELQRVRIDEAQAAFQRAVELDPLDPLAHSGLAYSLLEKGRDDAAEEALAEALMTCESAFLHGQYGSLLVRQGRYEEAVDQLERGLELEPENEELLLLFARHLSESEDEMRGFLERALVSDPDFVEALCELGALFWLQENATAARRCFARALELDDECLEALHGLSETLRVTDPREAMRLAGRSIEIDPEEPRGWSLMGEALWELSHKRKAHRALERACAIRPVRHEGARAFWLRAQMAEQEGLLQHAIWRLEEASAHAHLWPPIASDLGRLYADIGRTADARRWLHVALEHDTDDDASRRLLSELDGQ